MYDIITIGDSLLDTFLILDDSDNTSITTQHDTKMLCFNYAEKIAIKNSVQSIGGNAANVAVGAAKLALKTAIVTQLGNDITGHAIHRAIKLQGVDTKFIRLIDGKETRYSVVLNYKAERTILSYHPEREYTLPKLPKTNWIYYTSMGKTFEQVHDKLKLYLKKHPSTKLAMNPGSYQFQKGLKHIKSLLPFTNVLIVNKEEATALVGKKDKPEQYLKALRKKGVPLVVLTDSMNGSYASDGVNTYHMPSYPIKPLAKTGAGDAYSSGFLSALAQGKTLPEAMQWGTANAGGVIQHFGAQNGLLTARTLKSSLKQYAKIVPNTI